LKVNIYGLFELLFMNLMSDLKIQDGGYKVIGTNTEKNYLLLWTLLYCVFFFFLAS